MKIALASDHAAHRLKAAIFTHLSSRGVECKDFGTYDAGKSVDYSDFALAAAEAVAAGDCDFGIVVCGTGIGVSIAANKVKGIRAALCGDVFSAKATRLHNDANILAIGERVVGEGLALEIVDAFLATEYSREERHARRISKISDIEKKYFK